MLRLPIGRAGQALALLLLLLLAAAAWSTVGAPLLAWHADRADRLLRRETLLHRMAALARAVPALEHAAAATKTSGPAPIAVLQGSSDAVAGASLQQTLQGMASRTGVPLTSVEALPVETLGAYRRISVRLALSAPWPALVALLDSIAGASPQMLVDDLQLHGQRTLARDGSAPLDATFVVMGFRSGAPGR